MKVKDAKKRIEKLEKAIAFMSDIKNTGFRQALEEQFSYDAVDEYINTVRNSMISYKALLNKAIEEAEIDIS